MTSQSHDAVCPQESACYALITPVRDEEEHIGAMIESISSQSLPPSRWIIVDDGSSDRTAEIVQSCAGRLNYLELVRLPPREQRLAGGEGAIPAALRLLDLNDYEFLARFDADLVVPPDYIANVVEHFRRNPRLGIAGGALYFIDGGKLQLEADPVSHVRGALKMYRSACFRDIGGLSTRIGWDTLDEVSAWTKGWESRSFIEHGVLHLRPTGTGIRAHRVYRQRGLAEYLTWSDPRFVFCKSVKIAFAELSVAKPLCYLWGYLASCLAAVDRVKDKDLVRLRRAHQRTKIREALRPRLPRLKHQRPALPSW